MEGATNGHARRPLLAHFFIALLVTARADFHMPSMTAAGTAAGGQTTTQCQVCTTVTPSVSLASRAANAATGLPPTQMSPTPRVDSPPTQTSPMPHVAGPGPDFTPAGSITESDDAGLGASASPLSDVVAGNATAHAGAGGAVMGRANEWFHKQFPDTPKNLNVPMIAGLATGGAAVASGIIATAVTASQHKEGVNAGHAQSRGFLAPAPTPAPADSAVASLPHTILTTAISKGDTRIEVESTTGFAIGDTIQVGDEFNLVRGFGSIILSHPMNYDHPSGMTVQVVHQPPNAVLRGMTTSLSPTPVPVNTVLSDAARPTMSARNKSEASTEKEDKNARMFLYAGLAGLLACFLCCCCAAFISNSRKGRKRSAKEEDEYSGLSELSEDEEEEAEEEEEEEDPEYNARYSNLKS